MIDVQFANIPGMLEDTLRDVLVESSLRGEDYDPLDVSSQITVLKDTKLMLCKLRGTYMRGEATSDTSWLPSRINSRITRFPIEGVINPKKSCMKARIGRIKSDVDLSVEIKALDGKLNIITGRKGTGKSHLSKLLVLSLVDHMAPSLILDVNGEYVNLSRSRKSGNSSYDGKIHVLTPGLNLRFSPNEVGLRAFLSMLIFALDLPSTSARVFSTIWHSLQAEGKLSVENIVEAVRRWDCHESVRDALQSRMNTIVDLRIFMEQEGSVGFNYIVEEFRKGHAIVINMKDKSSTARRIIVELLLSKLTDLLSNSTLRALFLFAEEAHLYLRETYWDDVVTRMRHLGFFTTFITNQPNTISESIYRQADNLFVFNFTNEHDLEVVSRAAKIDVDSMKMLAKDLPAHHCLIVGDAVKDFPVIVGVRELDVETMGETRFFFQNQ